MFVLRTLYSVNKSKRMYYLVTNRKTEEEVQFYSIEEVREFLDTQKDSETK